MSNLSAKFVPALFASILAGANLTTMTDLRAQAPAQATTQAPAQATAEATGDNCLAAPTKGATPAGGHWYYRIDRATKRKCWYLREKDEKAARATPQESPPAPASATEEAAPPPRTTISRKAIADARAEWVSQQARTEQNFSANADPGTTGAIPALPVQDGNLAAGTNVLAPTPLASTRWPETPTVSSSSNPAELRTAAADQPSVQPEQAQQVQQPAAAPVAPAAVESSAAKPAVSLQMLFLVMAAALALAGITVSLVMRIGRARARAAMRRNRPMIWDSVDTMRSPPLMPARERATRTAPLREQRVPEDRERQVKEMLARLARSAQT